MNFSDLLIRGGATKAEYPYIQDKMHESNRNALIIFSAIASFGFLVMLIPGFLISDLRPYIGFYITGGALSLCILLIAALFGKTNKLIIKIDVYLLVAEVLAMGIALGTYLSPNENAAMFVALMLTFPQLFTERPIRMHGLIILSIIVFIILAKQCKPEDILFDDILNALIFGVLSILMCTYSISTRVRKFALEVEIRTLAENDQLTGLKNRYSYQVSLDNITALRSTSFYCVYVDVNGLHELNDTKGHEAGDIMLKFIATTIQDIFGKENSYRIGGDEMVVLGQGKELDEISAMVETLKTRVENEGYHVAVGISRHIFESLEVDAMIKEAESKMYQDKNDYYNRIGNDKRRKRL